MQTKKMEIIMENSNETQMSPTEVLFGSVMAAASIYAAWCTVSLIILAIS